MSELKSAEPAKKTTGKTIARWCYRLRSSKPVHVRMTNDAIAAFKAALPTNTAWNDAETLDKIGQVLEQHKWVMQPFSSCTAVDRFRLIMIAIKSVPEIAERYPELAGFMTVNWGTVKPMYHEYLDVGGIVARFLARYPVFVKAQDRLHEREEAQRKAATKPVQQELGLAASSHQPDVVALALAVAKLKGAVEEMDVRLTRLEEHTGLCLHKVTVEEVKP